MWMIRFCPYRAKLQPYGDYLPRVSLRFALGYVLLGRR